MTTLDVLQQARALISDPAHWTQGEYALNVSGHRTYIVLHDACAWCAIGAIREVANDKNDVVLCAQRALAQSLSARLTESEETVIRYNDAHTHADVLALFDAAIARLESAVLDKTPVPPSTGGLE